MRTATSPSPVDPYLLVAEAAEAPPTSFAATLGRIGPGMVLAASGDEPGIFLVSPDAGAKPGMRVK